MADVRVVNAEALEALADMPDASVDAVVTDPPYGLEFMGKEWDGADGFRRSLNSADAGRESVFGRASRTSPEYRAGALFQQWCEAWAAECLRVLKPGGHLLAFGGARTVHRLTCAIEDAGFEIRDGIDWLYGSGFPKSLNVSKAIDKAAGAEREVIATVPGRMPQAQAQGWGNPGADNFRDARRGTVDMAVTAPATEDAARWSGWGTALKPAREPIVVARKPFAGTVAANVLAYGTGALNIDACRVGTSKDVPASPRQSTDRIFGLYGAQTGAESGHDPNIGRWPSNVVLSHAPDCAEECLPGCPVAELDRQSGNRPGAVSNGSKTAKGLAGSATFRIHEREQKPGYADDGGASRFFPVFRYQAKAPTKERPKVNGIAHPTVKPLALMRWLVRLVTPPNGTVLDPFAGSGTTAEACLLEGFDCIVIERETSYIPLIEARIERQLRGKK